MRFQHKYCMSRHFADKIRAVAGRQVLADSWNISGREMIKPRTASSGNIGHKREKAPSARTVHYYPAVIPSKCNTLGINRGRDDTLKRAHNWPEQSFF